ncbi:MAG: hypothetical protein WA581_19170 [Candidatus Acidiferrales bacterium]
MKMVERFRILAMLFVLAAALRARAYEYPLTSEAIREAYILGTGPGGSQADFYTPYAYSFHMPNTDLPGSLITIETPFLQVAEQARQAANYDAQDAVKKFLGKPAVFRVYADVYYRPRNPEAREVNPNQVRVTLTLIQNREKIVPESTDRWPLTVFRDAGTGAVSVGEHVQIEFAAEKIDDSPLTIKVSAPDNRSAKNTFDLARIR